ncbi:unnamed protein product [Linum tenue]|nr:unnamed protein product [Linum tenue]
MGEMGGRNTRPEEGGQGLAGHVRHRRGRSRCVRQGRSQVQRQQGQAQLPRTSSTPLFLDSRRLGLQPHRRLISCCTAAAAAAITT